MAVTMNTALYDYEIIIDQGGKEVSISVAAMGDPSATATMWRNVGYVADTSVDPPIFYPWPRVLRFRFAQRP